ncbi:hypothetical protein ACFE04_021215 [Oxalis oulophora]
MRKKKNKKERVPPILWKAFNNGAKTLNDTILSLIPPHSPATVCTRGGCLQCTRGDATSSSFLLRDHDPPDYRRLLNRCYVVVSHEAPPFDELSSHSSWSQRQIVERTIEMLFAETRYSNVMCTGYANRKHNAAIVDLLACSAWEILLSRVGDSTMVYLLRNSSIFLPLSNKKHHQVAGSPISKIPSVAQSLKASFIQSAGPENKRKRDDIDDSRSKRQQLETSSNANGLLSSISMVGCSLKSCQRPFGMENEKKHDVQKISKAAFFKTCTSSTTHESDLKGKLQQGLKQAGDKGKKRSRPFRWQRQRIRSEKIQECDSSTPSHTGDNSLRRVAVQCSCCLALQAQAPQLVNPVAVALIDRRYMFYNSTRKNYQVVGTGSVHNDFPGIKCELRWWSRDILNRLKPNLSGVKRLLGNVFGFSDVDVGAASMTCSHSNACCNTGSSCLYHSVFKLLKLLIQRAKSCKHRRLLNKHCPVSSFKENGLVNIIPDKKDPKAGHPQSQAGNHYCSKHQVVSFIWAVCRSVVPPQLLGTPANWRILRRNIAKLVELRRFESFSLRQCMHNVKISKFSLLLSMDLSYPSTLAQKVAEGKINRPTDFSELNHFTQGIHDKLLVNWLYWLFSSLIVPLLHAHFYITESEHGKQEVYYYRKSAWKHFTNKAIACLKEKTYYHLDDVAVRNIISMRTFGFSKVRLLPKKDGIRILANLRAPSITLKKQSSFRDQHPGMRSAEIGHKNYQYRSKSVNTVLRDTRAVLKGLALEQPDVLGSSVFDYNDVYKKLLPFLISLRNGAGVEGGVFFVVSDVSKAFDSIDQDMLLKVMNDVLQHDNYLLEKSNEVVCTKRCLRVHEHLISTYKDKRKVSPRCIPSVNGIGTLHSVHVNEGGSRFLKKDELIFTLTELVKHNILQFGKKLYLQGIGIPQGSVVSSLLCSFYYGHLERNVIYPDLDRICKSISRGKQVMATQSGRDISSPNYILLRFVDDFLFISTSRKLAADFFFKMREGFRDYNCIMNEEKFGLNFESDCITRQPSNRMYVGKDGVSFMPWSGLLINSSTLEVQADYTRYWSNHLRSTLTVSWQSKPARYLKTKLHGFMRPKCHPILYDSTINSASVVRLNIYQAFLLSAMKFHSYAWELSYNCKLQPRLYLRMIVSSIRYMFKLLKRRMRILRRSSNLNPVLQLERREVEWLGLNAFMEALKRKQTRNKQLLSLLRSKLAIQEIGKNPSNELKYAVDRSHSSLMWKIKY